MDTVFPHLHWKFSANKCDEHGDVVTRYEAALPLVWFADRHALLIPGMAEAIAEIEALGFHHAPAGSAISFAMQTKNMHKLEHFTLCGHIRYERGQMMINQAISSAPAQTVEEALAGAQFAKSGFVLHTSRFVAMSSRQQREARAVALDMLRHVGEAQRLIAACEVRCHTQDSARNWSGAHKVERFDAEELSLAN
jgi:hypothetical protein